MPAAPIIRTLWLRLRLLALILALVLGGGTLGYHLLSGGVTGWLDCLYMTVITVTTIGYGEMVDFGAHVGAGRLFTMALAFAGVGLITYVVGNVTQFAVDGEFRRAWRAYRMQRTLESLAGHFIIAGWSDVAAVIARELAATRRPFVVLAARRDDILRDLGQPADPPPVLEGDPTDDDRLQEAGVTRAAGVFAAAADDTLNTVICLSARRLNPSARIVANVRDGAGAAKMKKVGADSTVSAQGIGGLRMASEMVRPAVVSFLDRMLRTPEASLRVEEVRTGPAVVGRSLGELSLNVENRCLLLAIHHGGERWEFHPPANTRIAAGDTLVFMMNAEERQRLEHLLGATAQA